jgi:hypothetical protein
MAAKKDAKMVTAAFRNHADAQSAYNALVRRGYTDAEINVLMSDRTRSTYFAVGEGEQIPASSMATEGMGIGGAVGTAVGATLAAVAAIGSTLVIPGLNLVIAGPIAAALAGGGAGAVTGGLLGALIGYGIPEDNAQAYHEALKEGGVVVGVVPRSSKEANDIQQEFKDLRGDSVCYC